LAETRPCTALAVVLDLDFHRSQFTPGRSPADLIGTLIYRPETGAFVPKKGPVFANLVLADEINRAPAKVQSALLEAMQERQVTIGDTTYPLPQPFFVMATQNPIEQEGTYTLPEAQLDRFMMMVLVSYPTREEERKIMDRMSQGFMHAVRKVTTAEQIMAAREVINQIHVEDRIKEYIIDLVFATRDPQAFGLGDLSELIEYGVSPRASIFLNRAARAHAFLDRRSYVTPDDVKAIGFDVLRHRVILSYAAEAEELTSQEILQRIFEVVQIP